MGETFGHVVPGVFYSVIALLLLLLARINRDEPSLALTGSRKVRATFGWGCTVTAGVGLFLEGAGGVIHSGNFFLQLAHETMYLAFLCAGVAAILESRGILPNDSWRLSLVMAFFVEGLVFFGHALEQEDTEQMLHFVMVFFSWSTSGFYIWACVSPRSSVPHVMGTIGMLAKGIWFFVISDILYSGKYGKDGEDYMVAMIFTSAGILVIFLYSCVSCCIYSRSSASYFEDDADPESLRPMEINGNGKVQHEDA